MARGLTAEATRSSCLCDEASVSGTEPTTASVICTQEDPYDGDASVVALGEIFKADEMIYASSNLLTHCFA